MLCFSSSSPWLKRSPCSGMCLCLINICSSFGIPHGHSLLPRPSLSPRLGLALLHATSLLPPPPCPSQLGFPDSSNGKEYACNARDIGLIPGLGRPPGEENSNPLQYSCLENSMDRGDWRATQSMGSQRVRHDWVTNTFYHHTVLKLSINFLSTRVWDVCYLQLDAQHPAQRLHTVGTY